MKLRTIGLRILSLIFGLLSLAHIARLWAQTEIVIGGYHLGQIPNLIPIIITGALSIWLSKLAGPWRSESDRVPMSET
jgi:hypothetical protein